MDLACPCEENMEAWHNAKVSKYMPLKSIRAYCSRSVLYSLKSLGLTNHTINTTTK